MKTDVNGVWERFAQEYGLIPDQIEQFKRYAALLQNSSVNVTALHELSDIVEYHFADSLALNALVPLSTINSFADVGTGGGLPGLALKLYAPHCAVVLIEVVGKKRDFLASVVAELGLQNVVIEGRDWRTFLRKADFSLDLICSRAALAPSELVRMFQPSCPYRNAQLVYWASTAWQPTSTEQPFIKDEYLYAVGSKERKLVLMGQK